MFDDMSIAEVDWKDEMQRMVDQHGLLKEIAQGGCHVGENRFMFKAQAALNRVVHEVPSQVVWDEELLQSSDSEDDLLLLLSESATITEHVEFMDQVTSSGDAQEVFSSIHSDREATSLIDEGALYSCKVSECAAVKVLTKMPLPDVVWDEEPQHDPKSDLLLLQLMSGEEIMHNASNHAGLLQMLASGSNDLDTPILLQQLVWDDELLPSLDSQDYLLLHLAPGEERKDSTHRKDKCNNYLHIFNVGERSLVIAATLHFEGNVARWLQIHKKQHPNQSWDQFVHLVQSQFRVYDYRTALTMLFECKQESEYDAIKVFNENPWSDVVLDDEDCEIVTPIVQLAINEKVTVDTESIDGEKAKGVIGVDTDKVLTHISCMSHFLEICETSNADEEGNLVAEILTHESGLLQYLGISMSSADHGQEEMLELNDQVSCEIFCEGNENVQLEEVYVACLGMMLQSTRCVTNQISPQYLNHQCQSHSCVAGYGTWAGQDRQSDCKDLLIFDAEQGVCGGSHYVASGVTLWRQSALSPRNSDTKVTCSIFNKILSWNRSGFTPGESDLQLALHMMPARQWDPSIPVLFSIPQN